ncbi:MULTISPECIES: hypothetical protein [unclassified Pseudodesulfovibrio]|uniref:hypothetical protein n=1 Tax=unclassified Pseudodesulfovibrio TaxID=2661612 RepID=UPI000FEB8485|nr:MULTISPECIES: hypothetical protein [unclassified Pseudodesulfovibrio]MCJ2164061.1 hypothetical protein [Pseudodesulfovibrio sp. S3-i]RWU05305.1 hypothetical protein DWB63_06540 [Pseudodesulfovibrio sp. S3]
MNNNVERLRIAMVEDAVAGWNYLLQKGFALEAVSGMSMRLFLREILGFDDNYIDTTVRTIFLNNSPVDDLETAKINDGDRIALGSAMPGLVGIVMGRNNPYKSFRSDISVREGSFSINEVPAIVSVKIFSTLAVESGRDLLRRGILVDANMLASFLIDKKAQIVEADEVDADTILAKLEAMSGNIPISVEFV